MTLNEFDRENALTMKPRGYLQLTSDLGWAGETTTFINVLSTDSAVFSSLNERVFDDHALMTLGGRDYYVNKTEGQLYTDGGVTTDALVYAATSDGYLAARATTLVVDGVTLFAANKPVSLAVGEGEPAVICYSSEETVNLKLRLMKKQKKTLINETPVKGVKYRDGNVTLSLPQGNGEIVFE